MAEQNEIPKKAGNLISMRAYIDGASLEGLRGIKAVLEAEIGVLQLELQEVEKRIREKLAIGYPEDPLTK